jgi:hypothetical protein
MKRTPCKSSRIKSHGWENNIMELEFCDGVCYQYHLIPRSEYDRFCRSKSLGCALRELEKKYRYNRV